MKRVDYDERQHAVYAAGRQMLWAITDSRVSRSAKDAVK